MRRLTSLKTLKALRDLYPARRRRASPAAPSAERSTSCRARASINAVPATTDKFVRAHPRPHLERRSDWCRPPRTALRVTLFLNEVRLHRRAAIAAMTRSTLSPARCMALRSGSTNRRWPSRRRRVDHFHNLGVPPHERLRAEAAATDAPLDPHRRRPREGHPIFQLLASSATCASDAPELSTPKRIVLFDTAPSYETVFHITLAPRGLA